jgi:hypothetical protein
MGMLLMCVQGILFGIASNGFRMENPTAWWLIVFLNPIFTIAYHVVQSRKRIA